jgi:hypothetical protein
MARVPDRDLPGVSSDFGCDTLASYVGRTKPKGEISIRFSHCIRIRWQDRDIRAQRPSGSTHVARPTHRSPWCQQRGGGEGGEVAMIGAFAMMAALLWLAGECCWAAARDE